MCPDIVCDSDDEERFADEIDEEERIRKEMENERTQEIAETSEIMEKDDFDDCDFDDDMLEVWAF